MDIGGNDEETFADVLNSIDIKSVNTDNNIDKFFEEDMALLERRAIARKKMEEIELSEITVLKTNIPATIISPKSSIFTPFDDDNDRIYERILNASKSKKE